MNTQIYPLQFYFCLVQRTEDRDMSSLGADKAIVLLYSHLLWLELAQWHTKGFVNVCFFFDFCLTIPGRQKHLEY